MRAALWLAQAGGGEAPTHSEAELQAQIEAAGEPIEIVRAAAVMIGGLGEHIAESWSLSEDVDTVRLMAAGVRRLHESGHVATEGIPLAAGLLTAALVARVDTLAWIDEVGPKLVHMAVVLGVLTDLMELIDMAHEQPGTAAELIAAVLGEP